MTQVARSWVRRKHAWNKVLEFISVKTKILLAAVKIIYCKMYERYQTAGLEASSQGDNLWINFENVFKPVAFCWKFSSQLPSVEKKLKPVTICWSEFCILQICTLNDWL